MIPIHHPIALQWAIERSRSTSPNLPVYRPGMGYCEGCRKHKPRPARLCKGWRCSSCKGAK